MGDRGLCSNTQMAAERSTAWLSASLRELVTEALGGDFRASQEHVISMVIRAPWRRPPGSMLLSPG